MSSENPGLGSCCGCRTQRNVRVLVAIKKKAPILGRGWGCLTCGLPSDGAVAVLCEECAERIESGKPDTEVILYACKGYPYEDERVSLSDLKGIHQHDMTKHPEVAIR